MVGELTFILRKMFFRKYSSYAKNLFLLTSKQVASIPIKGTQTQLLRFGEPFQLLTPGSLLNPSQLPRTVPESWRAAVECASKRKKGGLPLPLSHPTYTGDRPAGRGSSAGWGDQQLWESVPPGEPPGRALYGDKGPGSWDLETSLVTGLRSSPGCWVS